MTSFTIGRLKKLSIISIAQLKWGGCWFGVAGAGLLALNLSMSAWGFVLFLLSNVCWIIAAKRSRDTPLSWQHYAFTCTSLVGIYQWII